MKRAAASPLLPLLGTALAYAVVGLAALALAIPPGYASPLYPSAGIALACALVYGVRVLPGVALGSFAVNVVATARHGPSDTVLLVVLPAALALGAALQALVGAELVKRWVAGTRDAGPDGNAAGSPVGGAAGGPLRAAPTLDEPRDVALFFLLGAAVACVVSASVAAFALGQAEALAGIGAARTWWTWWAGDALGTLIGAPVALTLIGRPRAHWASRRLTVAVPLLIVTALLAAAIAQVARWEERRARSAFARDATAAANALDAQLRDAVQAVQAVRGVFVASQHVTRDEMRRASAYWLDTGTKVQALGYAQRVPRDAIPAFEADVRAESGLAPYAVFDRSEPGAAELVRGDRDVLAIRYIEPLEGNRAALGVNVWSSAEARAALRTAARTGRAAATAGVRLTQEVGDQTGVVVYHALYAGDPATEAEREASMTGAVFATLRMQDAVGAALAAAPPYLRWCLVDTEAGVSRPRLAGDRDCDTVPQAGFALQRSLDFAGRRWLLSLAAPWDEVPGGEHGDAWLFSLVGLLAASLLGALLLIMTGRTRRIEAAVAERTDAMQREVGERRRTEDALRESEQRLRGILDQVPIGVVETDLDGTIRETNPTFRALVGYTHEELAALDAMALTHPDDREVEAAQTARLLQGEIRTLRRQRRYLAKDGQAVWAFAVTTVLRDASGRPLRLLAVVEDISERLRLQEAERARERAEAASRAKTEFLSRMSHELRTPLNAMLGFAQLLDLDRQPPLPPHQREWTGQIQQAGWHLLQMINDTLDLSRIEAGTMKLEPAPVALADAIREACALVEQDARQRGLDLSLQIDPRAGAVLGDPTRVKQVLTNLLSNAVKYNRPGGTVRVATRLEDAHTVEIEVVDTGLGMTPRQLADLFQPFNRLGREGSAEGTGIGLVISRRLAELMGGALRARSIAGEGSSFILTMPRAELPGGEAPVEAPAAPGEAPYRQRIVHYVEDNRTNAEVMRGILLQRPQVRLEVSSTAQEALAMIRSRSPSLVLLDMHLPDMDGLDLLRRLKEDDHTTDIPVIVVSADATPDRIERALEMGAAGYLTKPVSVNQILSVLDQQLERLDTKFG